MDTVLRLAPWYVTGLIESQGSFVASASRQVLQLSFELGLPGADLRLLAAVQRTFGGIGRLRSRPSSALWRVNRRLDLLQIVEHLEAFPLQGIHGLAFAPWAALVRQRAVSFRRPLPPEAWTLVERLHGSQPRRRGRHAPREKSQAAVDEGPSAP
jgi:hypothetical protein